MMTLDQWAVLWGVPPAAMEQLRTLTLPITDAPRKAVSDAKSEAAVSERILLASAERDDLLMFRNNVGAWKHPETGRVVRYGLGNESKRVNETIKSADFIGIWRKRVTLADVGKDHGLLVSTEAKREDEPLNPNDPRTAAQLRWAQAINSFGGIATIYAGGECGPFDHLTK